MLRIVTVGIEPQAMAERRFLPELFFGYACEEFNEVTMGIFGLSSDFLQWKTSLLFRRDSIEGIYPAIGYGIARRFSALKNGRQLPQRFLFPGRYVGENVSNGPLTSYAGLDELRIRQPSIGFSEVPPRFFKSL